ncbi:MAG: hypothetical protein COS97_01410 [Candidatus Nealsonbacteria bacterium CG07_land_8_20_14_0_80_40_10]|nr:MAG: hypothetical protein COU44_02925 [Candidatus Nealsonbacteria bacterium CG10_big_fil_rev_8_21_14_0_10_40_24]PIU43363.1 MAG: hypothetical protein COS97_01410 [Candidatus Nealsonbacteria bacterium CG07_land_8_20_14_0_80_40_10]
MVAEKPAVQRLGISLASYLPWAAYFPGWAARKAKEAGYSFLQVVSFRGVDPYVSLFKLPVKYWESAWNENTGLYSVISGKFRHDPKAPTIMDWVFFHPTGDRNYYQEYQESIGDFSLGSRQIVHHLKTSLAPNQLYEPNPGEWLTANEIIAKIRADSHCLVLDTYHLRRLARADEMVDKPQGLYSFPFSMLGNWPDSLRELLPHAAAIHVAPKRDDNELEKCLAGQYTELEEMMVAIKKAGFQGDYVVEATIGLRGLNPKKVVDTMARFHDWVAPRI